MGTCLSSQKQKDVALQQYEDPVKVAQVLTDQSASMDLKEYFSPLEKIAQDEWQLDTFYIFLPSTKLQHGSNGTLQSKQKKPKKSKKQRGSMSRVVPLDGRQPLLKSQVLADEWRRMKFGHDRNKLSWRRTLSPIPEHFAYCPTHSLPLFSCTPKASIFSEISLIHVSNFM